MEARGGDSIPESTQALIRAIVQLDTVMKQPLTVGVLEDGRGRKSITINDEQITTALKTVRREISACAREMEELVQAIQRTMPGSRLIQ